MKYIYSREGCQEADVLMARYKAERISFVSRKSDRLSNDPRIFDTVDRTAMLNGLRLPLTSPVVIDYEN
jgi:hypothetical protein